MKGFKKLEWNKSFLGKEVTVMTNKHAKQRGFEINVAYQGSIREEVDWMVGCPVFECDTGKLGLGYECFLVELIK